MTKLCFKALLLSAAIAGTPAIASAEKLVLGNEGAFPPFSVVDAAGNLTGPEPDIAREMCKRMGAECKIVVMDFKALLPAMLAKKLDGIVTQIKPTAERKAKALFSVPVVFNSDTYVVKADTHYTYTKEGLKGVRFGVQRGSSQARYLESQFGDAIQVTLYDNPDQVRLDMLAGRTDATLGPRINWSNELIAKPEGKDWKLDGESVWTGDASIPEAERGSSWIVPKDNEALLGRMNTALTSMLKDCTFTTIRKKYLPVEMNPAEKPCL
jgi:ABC-type amino acid transport substrate-binding protein